LSPAGAVVTSFANSPIAQMPGASVPPFEAKNGDHFCNGLFVLAGGSVEGISGVQIGRLTPSGLPEDAFGTAGSTRLDVPTEAAAIAPDGETFVTGQRKRALVLTGILANGQPDPALGGIGGRRFAVEVPRAAGQCRETKKSRRGKCCLSATACSSASVKRSCG